MSSYLVPRDTLKVLQSFSAFSNMGLTLARYVPHEAIGQNKPNKHGETVLQKDNNAWLKEVCKKFKPPADLVKAIAARQQALTADALSFTATARSRLIVGLGGKGVLETGITLHHVTGLPIIPGSALKGLARAYALYEIAATLDPKPDDLNEIDEQLAKGKFNHHEEATFFREAFGDSGEEDSSAGVCVFFDALVSKLPQSGTLFEVDVMTPHFRQYYENAGGKPPSDDDSPNPITFVTVAAGTGFRFAVGMRRGGQEAAVVEWAAGKLQMGLEELGIGAKTAAGYGVFHAFQPDLRPKNEA